MHGPQFFIDYDIIIVTVNYRLGPLGQLSLDTGLVSGNQVSFIQTDKEFCSLYRIYLYSISINIK